MKSIVVSGVIANKHRSGGAIWTRLNWTLGLRKLGFDVYFVEEIEPASCVDGRGVLMTFKDSENCAVFPTVMQQFGLAEKSALLLRGSEQVAGLSRSELREIAGESAALINISGHLQLPELRERFQRSVYIDLDPGFTQIWEATGQAGARLEGHDFYFTVGENIGRADCIIPTAGRNWRATRQPSVAEFWRARESANPDRFTTIASWRGPYGPLEFAGQRLGLKAHEWRKFIDLPQRVPAQFEIALDIHPAEVTDLAALQANGWRLVAPRDVAGSPRATQEYIAGSAAEFSVAQGVYVGTNSGWVSDRTVCYLASGRPALVQDTGFSRNYETGAGLVAFRTMDEAVAGAESILANYPEHCRAARALAERHFDSDKVLGELLDQIGVSA